MTAETTPAFRPLVREDEVRITEAAREQLTQLFQQVDDEDVEAIRIFVGGGGCAGMRYGMTFTDFKTDYDKVLAQQGFQIYVDTVAMHYLRGVEIDYVERPTGASFVFNNVFAATGGSGTCGRCGAAVGAGGGCG